MNAAGWLWGGLLDLIYPPRCLLCQRGGELRARRFCLACHEAVFRDTLLACPRCAATAGPYSVREDGCSLCRTWPFAFDAVLRLGPYRGVLEETVLRLKHAHQQYLGEVIGECWAEEHAARFRAAAADVIVPVPLHWWRWLLRGHNQCLAVSRGLSRRLGIPCRPGWLRRTRHTPKQSTRSSVTERFDNVRGAFRAGGARAGGHVLLVDDILTTGATASEAARILKNAGAARVTVAVLARAGTG